MNLVELVEFTSKLGQEYLFRGQANKDWRIISSFDRKVLGDDRELFGHFLQSHDFSVYFLGLKKLIPELNSKLHLGLDELRINTLDQVETYSTLQHYGFPTPNIDWSKSVEIALWFLQEDVKERESIGSISILNQSMQKKAFDFYDGKISEPSFLQQNIDYHDIQDYSSHLRVRNQSSIMTFSGCIRLDDALTVLDTRAREDGLLLDGQFIFKKIDVIESKQSVESFLLTKNIDRSFIYPKENFDTNELERLLKNCIL